MCWQIHRWAVQAADADRDHYDDDDDDDDDRFIGELYKLRMLTETIMHDCLFKLLRLFDEDNLECLCQLLMTIGQELDNKQSKVWIVISFEYSLVLIIH